MKRNFIKILLCTAAIGLVASCKKDDDINKEIIGLGGDTWEKGPIDEWLLQNFTLPYNIDVKYRWDGAELAVDRTLVPVKEEKVIPLMETVRDAWIKVYTDEIGETFIKKLAPKQYVLVGSPQYNSGGTITLGEAEGGRKVTLFRVNDFSKSNRDIVKPILKTIHHEFGHILHQNVMYAPEYQLVTPTGYTSDWNNISVANARAAGYISAYAQSGPSEDFVEMIAIMLTEGKAGYETIIKGITNAAAVTALRKKEEIVVSYFKQKWNIEFYRLQNRTTKAISSVTSVVPLSTYLGFGKTYTSLAINPGLPDLSADFVSIFNTAKAGLAALSNNAGRQFDNFTFFFNANDEMVMRVYYRNAAGSAFEANFTYKMTVDANQNLKFVFVSADANANTAGPGIVALTNYLTQNTFKLDWYYSQDMKSEYGGLTKVGDPASYISGVLTF